MSEPHKVSEPCTCGKCDRCTFYERRAKMPKKVSRGITIPEELNEKLRYERPDINVSKVCERALRKALEKEPVFEGNKLVRDKNSK